MENASPFLPDWTWPLYSRRAQPCPQVPPWWAMTAYKKTTSLHCQQDNNNNNNNPAPRSLPAHPLEEWWYWHKGMEEQYWFSFFFNLETPFIDTLLKSKLYLGKRFLKNTTMTISWKPECNGQSPLFLHASPPQFECQLRYLNLKEFGKRTNPYCLKPRLRVRLLSELRHPILRSNEEYRSTGNIWNKDDNL